MTVYQCHCGKWHDSRDPACPQVIVVTLSTSDSRERRSLSALPCAELLDVLLCRVKAAENPACEPCLEHRHFALKDAYAHVLERMLASDEECDSFVAERT